MESEEREISSRILSGLWSVNFDFLSTMLSSVKETVTTVTRVTTSARFHRILFLSKHNFVTNAMEKAEWKIKVKSDLSLFETFSLLESLSPLCISRNVRGHFICPCTAEYNKQLKCKIRDNVMLFIEFHFQFHQWGLRLFSFSWFNYVDILLGRNIKPPIIQF